MKVADHLAGLIRTGFQAVGCAIPVVVDDGVIVVRDMIVECAGSITCLRAGDDGRSETVFTMPAEASQAAACAVVVRVLSGIVARAVEVDGALIGA